MFANSRVFAGSTTKQTASYGLLQRQCACGQHSPGGKECDECRKRDDLQRSALTSAAPATVPPIVHQALRSSGQPLDAGTRAIMEPRFGRNFSGVRVHIDRLAAESAESVNATAYTVGRRIVFGEGQYAPATARGRQLIAHELTHVVQQGMQDASPAAIGPSDDSFEREAGRAGAQVDLPRTENRLSSHPGFAVQREDKDKVKKKPPAAKQPPAAPPKKGESAQGKPSIPAAPPGGPVKGMKTSCDVKIDPRDMLDFQLKKDVRTVGTGEPQIGNLYPGLEGTNPCLVEAGLLHETVHVKNNRPACQAFKKCVDNHSSKALWIGDPKISHDDFVRCYNDNHGGNMPDCIADEKEAYEAMIKKTQDLLKEKRCEKEKVLLLANIKYWESIKDHDPDCPAPK